MEWNELRNIKTLLIIKEEKLETLIISPTRNPSSLRTKGFYQFQDDTTLQLHSTFRISLILLYNSTLVNF